MLERRGVFRVFVGKPERERERERETIWETQA